MLLVFVACFFSAGEVRVVLCVDAAALNFFALSNLSPNAFAVGFFVAALPLACAEVLRACGRA